MFGWWIVYIIVFFVFIVFWIYCIIMVVVWVFSLFVGLFMKMMEGLVINFIVIVSFFFCFVDNFVMFGNFIMVFFNGFNFISFNIFFIKVWLIVGVRIDLVVVMFLNCELNLCKIKLFINFFLSILDCLLF